MKKRLEDNLETLRKREQNPQFAAKLSPCLWLFRILHGSLELLSKEWVACVWNDSLWGSLSIGLSQTMLNLGRQAACSKNVAKCGNMYQNAAKFRAQ